MTSPLANNLMGHDVAGDAVRMEARRKRIESKRVAETKYQETVREIVKEAKARGVPVAELPYEMRKALLVQSCNIQTGTMEIPPHSRASEAQADRDAIAEAAGAEARAAAEREAAQ